MKILFSFMPFFVWGSKLYVLAQHGDFIFAWLCLFNSGVSINCQLCFNKLFFALRDIKFMVKLKSLCITRELIVGSLSRKRYSLGCEHWKI